MAALVEIKRVKNAILYQEPGKKLDLIMLQNVRLSYAYVGTPGEDENDDGSKKLSWRSVLMLPKGTHTEAKDLVKEIYQKLMKANDVNVPTTNWALENGDGEKYTSDEKYKAYRDHWLINVKDASHRPTARNRRGEVLDNIQQIDDMFYSGAWANVMIRPWYFNGNVKGAKKTYPKRLLNGFQSLQFVRDDTAFGTGRIDDGDVYGDLGDGDGGGKGINSDDDL